MNSFMFSFLIISYVMCVMSNSWITIWILLEVNTLTFCTVMKMNEKNETQANSESIMKYFIVQSIASGILVAASLFPKQTVSIVLFSVASLIALMIKAAAAPLHWWFIKLSKSSKWKTNLVLFTWQKMAPLYLVLFQLKYLASFFIISSVAIGAISMFNKKDLKEILAWSSIFNLGWIILSVLVSTKVFFLFLTLYWISVLFIILVISKVKATSLESLLNPLKKETSLFIVMNLAGLPPFMGFLAKWLSFSESLKMKINLIPTILLIMSTINLYLYLRMTSNSILKSSSPEQKSPKIDSFYLNWMFMLMNSMALITVMA